MTNGRNLAAFCMLLALIACGCDFPDEGPRSSNQSAKHETDEVPEPEAAVVSSGELAAAITDLAYAEYAQKWRDAINKAGQDPPPIRPGTNDVIGVLEGRFRVDQIVNDTTMMISRLDRHDFSTDSYFISSPVPGLSRRFVEDDTFGFGEWPMIYLGPQQYTTVIGASRTIRHYQLLSRDQLNQALDAIDQQEQAEHQQIEQAKTEAVRRRHEARMAVERFKAEQSHVADYIRLREMLSMYERTSMQEKAGDVRRQIEALPAVTDSDIEAYEARLKQLQEAVE